MAQLDQLIGALFQHSAQSLVLSDGEKPLLMIAGSPRPIVKAPLNALQLTRLLSEIAPDTDREAVNAGREARFTYTVDGHSVVVEVQGGGSAVIRGEQPDQPDVQVVEAPPEDKGPEGPLTMDWLFHQLFERGGSDLHVSSEARPILRIDGDMVVMTELPELDPATAERLLLSITPEHKLEEFRETGDSDFAYEIEGLCRFRCNLFRDRKGTGGVFRVIPSKILTSEDLGLSKAIQDLCYLTKGLVLVTGPTGSGKSTTLAAMMDLVNRTRSDHIITIEDPIEFVHPNKKCLVNQREVHVHTQGFKHALRAALREDPDIVLVGEMRDLETVAIAIETAETGHLVFGTLHTSSAVSTVDRVIDQFPADQQEQIRIMLSESLKAVISQVLLKKIGGGRVAGLEVMMVNAAVSNLIREGKTFQIQSIMQTGKSIGMVLLNDHLLDLVKRKVVEPQEAYLKAIDKHNLLTAFKAKEIKTDFMDGVKVQGLG